MATLLVTVFVQNEKANRGKTEQAAAVWRAKRSQGCVTAALSAGWPGRNHARWSKPALAADVSGRLPLRGFAIFGYLNINHFLG